MGLRRLEVLRIKAADLRSGTARFLGKDKGGGKRREVPISELVSVVLPKLLSRKRRLLAKSAAVDTGYLFGGTRGGRLTPLSRSWADSTMNRLFAALELKQEGNLHHALRRTFGRILWERSVPLEVIGELLGHENLARTIMYLAIDRADRATAVGVLNSVFQSHRLQTGRRPSVKRCVESAAVKEPQSSDNHDSIRPQFNHLNPLLGLHRAPKIRTGLVPSRMRTRRGKSRREIGDRAW